MKKLVIDASLQDLLDDLRTAKAREADAIAALAGHPPGSPERHRRLDAMFREQDAVQDLAQRLGEEFYAAWQAGAA